MSVIGEVDFMAVCIRYGILSVILLIFSIKAVQAESDAQQDLLFFLNAGPVYHQITSEDGIEENDFTFGAGILYSYLETDLRFLAEYFISTEESELERLQMGWQVDDDVIGWLGRFHSPSLYWNSVYHHGRYLQTSISRPLAEKFEDEGGVFPTHVSGFMFEGGYKLQGMSAIQSTLSFGLTSVIDDHGLVPFDLLDANNKSKNAVDVRIAYLTDQLGENQFGLTMSWASLVVGDNDVAVQQGLQRVDQSKVGAYVDWSMQEWRILSNLTYINNQMINQLQNKTDSFSTAYFQAEYKVDHDWIFFGRVEDTYSADNSDYLQLFPSAIVEREMLGLRFDFYKNHALTVEFSNIKLQSGDFGQAWLQWSAVFP
ncbi:MAG: hypothetical protein DIZ80_02050 [endosymbiont of Galathealinum brachiosum]|uniref:Porin domain-containing protein n=1 Tax=endosymbiont of Galathealinum brachiosum TaxID=2200906 RepID=A0A370DLL2_9GAMM|nr:MAG: hypothetical protein DIZ80_02050 [endosymbiont of Galathealinum brachiosum]